MIRNWRRYVVIGVFCSAIAAAGSTRANSDAQLLLGQMANAVKASNYRGLFLYEQNGQVNTIHINHGVIQDKEYESIYFMNGERRSLVRSGPSLRCDTLGGYLFKGGGLGRSQGGMSRLSDYYEASIIGQDRVANREAWVIELTPRDDYRLGYIFVLDKATHLPLKSMIKADDNSVLERFQFVDFTTEFEPKVEDYEVPFGVEIELAETVCEDRAEFDSTAAALKPGWIPDGFVLANYERLNDFSELEYYTDGLSSFSVVVERMPVDLAVDTITHAEARRGASFVLVTLIPKSDHTISVSVIGEVPPAVARRITLSMR